MRIVFATYPGRATALALAALVLLAGCSSGSKDVRARGSTLTIYTSVPLHGVSARDAAAVVAGERLALSDARARAGGHAVRLVVLDDSDPKKPGTWDPSMVERNAKRAAKDPATIAYIGELDFGGSAISVPVTNAKGIAQISPADGLTSLTQVQPGGPRTSPARYYPSGRRTFMRLVPTDLRQADELMSWIGERGARRVAIVHDDHLFGREMAAQAMVADATDHLSVTDVKEAPTDSKSYADLARDIASKHPDAIAYLGVGGPQAGLLLRQLEAARPEARLYGTSGLAAEPSADGATPEVDLLDASLPASSYGRAGRRVLARLERKLRAPVPVSALYGYEAMRLAIDGLNRAGRESDDREAVAAAALTPRVRRSVLGSYAIERTGDVLPARFGAYRLVRGQLEFEGPRPP